MVQYEILWWHQDERGEEPIFVIEGRDETTRSMVCTTSCTTTSYHHGMVVFVLMRNRSFIGIMMVRGWWLIDCCSSRWGLSSSFEGVSILPYELSCSNNSCEFLGNNDVGSRKRSWYSAGVIIKNQLTLYYHTILSTNSLRSQRLQQRMQACGVKWYCAAARNSQNTLPRVVSCRGKNWVPSPNYCFLSVPQRPFW